MKMRMKERVKGIVPPILLDFALRILNQKLDFVGDFTNFSDANRYAREYNQKIGRNGLDRKRLITGIEDIKKQNRIVVRDGNNNLVATILSAGIKRRSQHTFFLDVGGGGGNFYFLNAQKFLNLFPNYSYFIVEMPEVVEIGRQFFADDKLSFHAHVNEIEVPPFCDLKILILQGVLMYIEDVFFFLEDLFQRIEFDLVLLDRTAFSRDGRQHYKVQKIPKSLGYGALPWIVFSHQELVEFFEQYNFRRFDEFNDPLDADTKDFVMRGISFVRKDFF